MNATLRLPRPISVNNLYDLFDVDLDAGTLTWRARTPDQFLNGHVGNCRRWNAAYAGKPALASIDSHGYRRGGIYGRQFLAHRVIFAMGSGAWPEKNIDHIDGNPLNNAFSNLRDVSQKENGANRRSRGGSSAYKGVSWYPRGEKWRAAIRQNGTLKHLGYFSSEHEAARAYNAAALTRFGEFAHLNRVAE